ncbi:unnamed protein product [Rangifer tarandus platyrhynchus]|uniref:Uncharacterized protein n=2 Tax=Rangifer tarandus platyrhynchus TaxID=3082113 RepID=A0ABN8YCP0_RANTA|nr:unnamed protein product [Rangifer tarandus platyrhynchus]
MMFLSVLLKLLSGTPLHYLLQKGLLALTSAGAKHLTVIELQPSDPSKRNFGLFLGKKNHITAYKRELPQQWCFEQEKIITHISVEVFISDLKQLKKTAP